MQIATPVKFQSTTIKAKNLMQDDHFKFGGDRYRVTHKAANAFGDTVIHAQGLNQSACEVILMILPKNLKVTIYNQITE